MHLLIGMLSDRTLSTHTQTYTHTSAHTDKHTYTRLNKVTQAAVGEVTKQQNQNAYKLFGTILTD